MAAGPAQLRIGEVARRTGVGAELLRAWERRYGLLAPERTESGYRLYSDADVRRVVRMQELLAGGLSAAEAARQALVEPVDAPLDGAPAELRTALERLDDAGAHAELDRLLAAYSLRPVLEEIVLPLLRELGERWARGEVTVAQEHFASNVVRGRLLGLARGWDRGSGRRAVLACPPGERHDLGLLAFGLALREQGWRITFLGADTPADTLVQTVAALEPDAVVLATVDRERLAAIEQELSELSRAAQLWVGGAGADAVDGARMLTASPFEAAALVAAG